MDNYLILLIHHAYDIPGKTSDNIEMEDASDEVFFPYTLLYLPGITHEGRAFILCLGGLLQEQGERLGCRYAGYWISVSCIQ